MVEKKTSLDGVPINYIELMEGFIRIGGKNYAKELIKQIDNGLACPIIRIKLKALENENLIVLFRDKIQQFFEYFQEALINVAKYECPEITNDQKIHVIPDAKEAEWLIPIRENFSKDMTWDQERIFKFKGRFMSLGLERAVEFERMSWQCLVCGAEFETIPLYRKTREKYQTPNFCTNKRCKAKSKYDFRLLEERSIKYEKRTFTIIDLENQNIVNEIKCYISQNIEYFNEKAKGINCNDEIEVLGVLKMDTADLFSSKDEQELLYYINVVDISVGGTNDVNPTIVKQIKENIAKNQLYCNEVIDSIHPYSQNIMNFFPIKLCFGLSFITSDSYTHIRNGINSIVAGHAGTLKSKIGASFKAVLGANNFGIIFGKNTTAKGLVPVAQRNNNEKNLVKRYGAIPYYNKKTFLVDEAQYLYKKDPDALESFKCFEEGIISRALDGTTISAEAKGTVNLSLNYRTEDEAYDFTKTLVENLGFPDDQRSVLDRFDLHYRIPRNTAKIVKILTKRGSKLYKPKFLVSNEIIFNYFIEAKRIYSEGVDLSEEHEHIIEQIYNAIISERKHSKRAILNPREPEIIKKTLKGIAAMRLRKIVIDDDFEYFKKYLINTIIPFQDCPYIIEARTIDINEIFCNTFELLIEYNKNYFHISEFISFLRDYLESNYFQKDYIDYIGEEIPILGNFIDKEKNLSNNKFKNLLENEENREFIEKKGYIIEKMKNKTSFIKSAWAIKKIKKNINKIFKDNDLKPLEIKAIVQIAEVNLAFTKDFINECINTMIKNGIYAKLKDNKIKLK